MYFHSQGVFFPDSTVYQRVVNRDHQEQNLELPPTEPNFTCARHLLSEPHIPFILNEPSSPRASFPPWGKVRHLAEAAST